jgi:transposase-like protein
MSVSKSDNQVCLNEDCLNYKKRNSGKIIKRGFNAKGKQMFKCKTCGVRFPETKGTIFYKRHLTEEQIILICKLFVEKNGVRPIERIMEIHRDTITSLTRDLAMHAREVTDFLIKDVKMSQIEVDEMWSFIKKNKKTLSKEMLDQINMVTAGFTQP